MSIELMRIQVSKVFEWARSCKLQAASCKLQAASCKLQAASCKLQAASCKLQAASCKLQAARCVLYYKTNLARGPAGASPLHPLGSGLSSALSRFQTIGTFRRSVTRGRLRSPCTHRSVPEDQGAIAPLETHSQAFGRCTANQGSLQAPPIPPWPTYRLWIATGENSLSPELHRAGRRCPALPLAAPFGPGAFAPLDPSIRTRRFPYPPELDYGPTVRRS